MLPRGDTLSVSSLTAWSEIKPAEHACPLPENAETNMMFIYLPVISEAWVHPLHLTPLGVSVSANVLGYTAFCKVRWIYVALTSQTVLAT